MVSGVSRPEARLIRFVIGPDQQPVPDLARKLPGRGLWVEADRAVLQLAVQKGLFARAAKTQVKADAALVDQVEALLYKRCLDLLGLARRQGVLISGYDKAMATLKAGNAAWVIEANDGAVDGRGRILAVAKQVDPAPQVCGVFDSAELGLALGLENAIHHVLLAGPRSGRWQDEIRRLAGFRPLQPPDWNG